MDSANQPGQTQAAKGDEYQCAYLSHGKQGMVGLSSFMKTWSERWKHNFISQQLTVNSEHKQKMREPQLDRHIAFQYLQHSWRMASNNLTGLGDCFATQLTKKGGNKVKTDCTPSYLKKKTGNECVSPSVPLSPPAMPKNSGLRRRPSTRLAWLPTSARAP